MKFDCTLERSIVIKQGKVLWGSVPVYDKKFKHMLITSVAFYLLIFHELHEKSKWHRADGHEGQLRGMGEC